MAWLRKRAESSGSPFSNSDEVAELGRYRLPQDLIDTLNLFDAESIILANGEVVIYQSEGIANYKLLKDFKVINEDLKKLVRAARRSNEVQEVTLEIARGPIGEGIHDLVVRVAPIGSEGFILILIFDDSETRRLDSIRRDFVANISHELKTPIGALSILSEAVLGASDDPEAITRFATRMQNESSRLSALVQEIINLSKLQTDDPLKRAQVFDIDTCIRDAIQQCREISINRIIEVVYLDNLICKAAGARDQITMALSNLIENAINYSPEYTRVAITAKEVQGICEISISDQGIGIPEKDLERIFERFYRVDPARSRLTGGTGLGLSIVKHVITNHGGDIGVWSVEGAGSTFTVRIPIVNEVEEEMTK
jgi:two-component system, OmpR family, sensor histidine kinase SenX3